jgi:flagellar hook-length control protein FliK
MAEAGIAGQVSQALTDRPGKIELTLTPEELGRIRFEIQQIGDQVRMILTAERPDTLDYIRRNMPDFVADLRQAGFSGTDVSLGQWSRGSDGNTPSWRGAAQDDRGAQQGQNQRSWSRSDPGQDGADNPVGPSRRHLGLGPGQLAIRM